MQTRDPSFQVGDIAITFGGWQEYAVLKASTARKFDPAVGSPSVALGVLGMTGQLPHFLLLFLPSAFGCFIFGFILLYLEQISIE